MPKKPIRGTLPACCARATSGQPIIAPTSVMNPSLPMNPRLPMSMTIRLAPGGILPAAMWDRLSRTNRQVWSWRRFPQHCNPVACGALADN
jgi:hypothetical protein